MNGQTDTSTIAGRTVWGRGRDIIIGGVLLLALGLAFHWASQSATALISDERVRPGSPAGTSEESREGSDRADLTPAATLLLF